ncbi:MAG: hypothetical protein GX107_08935 [Clostridiales bacterium]|nr:hypothetical protein [Clostridiales bacterium]
MNKFKRVAIVFITALFASLSCGVFLPVSAKAAGRLSRQAVGGDVFVFVHGLNGWGGDEGLNGILPYWGASTGDLMEYLRSQGFDCYSASVGPISSAWDRACELYAQLTGSTVDYGKAHSEGHNHLRFGRTYSEPLIKNWGDVDGGETAKVHFIGHSFGGTAIRMLSHLLEYGDDAEIKADQTDISPLFTGGKGDMIKSVTTICTPHNSSTFYYPAEKLKITKSLQYISILYAGIAGRSILNGTYFDFHLEQFGLTNIPGETNADEYLRSVRRLLKSNDDMAQFDITPKGTQILNEYLETNSNAYHFSYSFKTTRTIPILKIELPIKSTNPLLFLPSFVMGIMRTVTDSDTGQKCGPEWRANDGLCSTFSQTYPFDEAHVKFGGAAGVEKGVWNVMPVSVGDHGTAIGLLVKDKSQTHNFYTEILNMLSDLD